MENNCDIKTSAEALNFGLDAFEKSYLASGDMTTALNFAVSKIQEKYPERNYDPSSFINYTVKVMKDAGEVSKSYFYDNKKTGNLEKQVEKIISDMKELPENKKKDVARNIFKKMYEKGVITEDIVKNIYAEALGLPSITPELDGKIEKAAESLRNEENVEKQLNDLKEEIFSKENLTDKENAEYISKVEKLKNDLFKAQNTRTESMNELSKDLSNNKFWEWQFAPMISMNLMSIPSIGKNLTGMATDAVFRNLSSIVSTPLTSILMKRNLFFSRWSGAGKNKAWKKFITAAKTGSPIEKTNKLGHKDYLNAVESYKEFLNSNGKDKLMAALGTIIKAHPDLIRRALVAPDFFVHSMVEGAELNRIGTEKGLKGAKLEAFIASPDEESAKRAKSRADEITLKKELPKVLGTRILEDISSVSAQSIYERMIASGKDPMMSRIIAGFVGIAKSMYFPFIKAPFNLFRIASKIVLPEARLLKGVIDFKNATDPDKRKIIAAETIGDVVVGFTLRSIALSMVSQGLISAGYDDDDEKTKEAVYKIAGGPNKVNMSAFVRGLTGGSLTLKPNDKWVDISSMGVVGLALGSYANAYHNMSNEEMKQETKYSSDLSNIYKIPGTLFASEFQSAVDLPFLSGYNQIIDMMKDKKGTAKEKFLGNSLKTLIGGLIPATHQQLSRSATGDVYVSYDKDKTLNENVFSMMKYNFAFGEGVKKKMSTLTSKEREAIKKKEYHLFDNYLGRVLYNMDPLKVTKTRNEEGDYPVFRIYEEAMKVSGEERKKLLPGAPSDEINIGSRNKAVKVKLTPEQHEYYQQQASLYRMIYAAPYIMSKDWEKDSFEEKTKMLESLYKEGLNKAKIDLKEAFPEISTKKGEPKKKTSKSKVNKYKRAGDLNVK